MSNCATKPVFSKLVLKHIIQESCILSLLVVFDFQHNGAKRHRC